MKLTKQMCLVVGLLGMVATSALASETTALNVGRRQETQVTKNDSGVYLIDIANPNKHGISSNVYSQFNINKPGMVFKNSAEAMQTQLAGVVSGNANLKDGSASLILNHVIGGISQLLGTAEVGGQKADLVISNPNGLVVNGMSVINAGKLTLTTATPRMDGRGEDSNLSGYDTRSDGRIWVAKDGLNAENIDAVNLTAPGISLEGEVAAKNLTVNAINGKTDAQGNVVRRNGGSLDATELGAMNAGTITVVAGAVNNSGSIDADTLVINHEGALVNKGTVRSYGDMALLGGDVQNYDEISAKKDLLIDSNGTVSVLSAADKEAQVVKHADGTVTRNWANSKTATVEGQNVTVNAENVKLQGAIVSAEKDLNVKAKNQITSEGISVYSNDYNHERKLIANTRRKGEFLTLAEGEKVNLVADGKVYLEGTVAKASDVLNVKGAEVEADYSRTREASHSWYGEDGTFGLRVDRKYRVVGVDLEGEKGVNLTSTVGDVKLGSTVVASKAGDVKVNSKQNLVTTTGSDKDVHFESSISLNGSTFLNPKLTFDNRLTSDSKSVSTRVVGDNVNLQAEKKVSMQGAEVNAKKDLMVAGQNGVVVKAGEDKHVDLGLKVTTEGSVGVKDKKATVNVKANVDAKGEVDVKRVDSKLTAGEVVNLQGGKDSNVHLENVTIKGDKVKVSGGDVTVTSAPDVNVKGGVHAGADLSVGVGVEKGGTLGLIKVREDLAVNAGSNLEVKTDHKGSQISGNNVNLTAHNGDLKLVGSGVNAKDLAMTASNDVKVQAAKNNHVILVGDLSVKEGMTAVVDPIEAIKAGVLAGVAAGTQGAAAPAAIAAGLKAVKVDEPTLGAKLDTQIESHTSRKGSSISADNMTVKSGNDLLVESSKVKAGKLNADVANQFAVTSLADHHTKIKLQGEGEGTVKLSNLTEAPTGGSGAVNGDLFAEDLSKVESRGTVKMGEGSEVKADSTRLNAGHLEGDGQVTSKSFSAENVKEHHLFSGLRGGAVFNVNKEAAAEGKAETVKSDAKPTGLEGTAGYKKGVAKSVVKGVKVKAQDQTGEVVESEEAANAEQVQPEENVVYHDLSKIFIFAEKMKEIIGLTKK